MKQIRFKGFNAFTLHVFAMGFMLCDHLWATIMQSNMWLTRIGRVAFPIFAFMLAEGFIHTHDRKRYILRLFFFAILSEIPFNLMYGGSIIYPFHQNVLWTFLIAFVCMLVIEKIRQRKNVWFTIIGTIIIFCVGWFVGIVLMVDYFGAGVVTVLLFYICRGRKWWQQVCLFGGLFAVNCIMLGGLMIPLNIWSYTVELPEQGLALLSLIFIWGYNGKQGPHNKVIQMLCYSFYPLHMLILSLLSLY